MIMCLMTEYIYILSISTAPILTRKWEEETMSRLDFESWIVSALKSEGEAESRVHKRMKAIQDYEEQHTKWKMVEKWEGESRKRITEPVTLKLHFLSIHSSQWQQREREEATGTTMMVGKHYKEQRHFDQMLTKRGKLKRIFSLTVSSFEENNGIAKTCLFDQMRVNFESLFFYGEGTGGDTSFSY